MGEHAGFARGMRLESDEANRDWIRARRLLQSAGGRGRVFFFLFELIALCKTQRENFEEIRLRRILDVSRQGARFPKP